MGKKKLFKTARPICFNEEFMHRVDKAYKFFKKSDLKRMAKQLRKIDSIKDSVKPFIFSLEKVDKGTFRVELDYIEKLIRMLKFNYENNGTFLLSDKYYDMMLERFKIFRIEPIEAELIMERAEAVVQHDFPLLKGTLDKARHIVADKDSWEDSVAKFISKVITVYNENDIQEPLRLTLVFKYDGTSAVFTIDPDTGRIINVVTRGKNNKGVSLNKLFAGKVFKAAWDYPANAVQCELMMTNENIKKYSQDVNYNYKNSRGSVTSILTSLKGRKYSKYLEPVPLRVIYESEDGTIDYGPEIIKQFKISKEDIPYTYTDISFDKKLLADSKNALMTIMLKISAIIDSYYKQRETLPFQIDGVVINVLNEDLVEILGRKGEINQYQIAYKFESSEEETELTDITYSVNRTGLVVPKAHYNEIIFNGTSQTKATLASRAFMEDLHLAIGDTILVEYSNDVIPYIKGVTGRSGNPEIKFPKTCPACGYELEEDGAHSFCRNPECAPKRLLQFTNFIKVLNFRDLSQAFIERLVDNCIIRSFEDIVHLDQHVHEMLDIGGIGYKTIDKYNKHLEKLLKDGITEDVLLTAVGVAGPKISQKILEAIPLLKLIQHPTEIYEVSIDSVDKSKDKIVQKIQYLNREGELERLYNFFKPIRYEKKEALEKVCFTGFRDKNLVEQLKEKRIDVVDGFKNISYMVVPNLTHSSRKTREAEKKDIPIIDIEELKHIYDLN